MKSIIQSILFLFLAFQLGATSITLSVGGSVTDASGAGIQNINVDISLVLNNSQSFYSAVLTDANGNYAETVNVPNGAADGFVTATILDCDSTLTSTTGQFVNGFPTAFNLDLPWCGNGTGSCATLVSVDYNPISPLATITAEGVGTAPFVYAWSNGQTGQSITTGIQGIYCVSTTAADGCMSSSCVNVQWNNTGACDVQIGLDSIGLLVYWTAYPTGTAPFTYQWSSGESTQSAQIIWGTNQCVTVADANGCVVTTCAFNTNNCAVSISPDPAGGLGAYSQGVAPFSFVWSNGNNTQSMLNIPQGFYCVTVTDANGCSDEACYQYGNNWDSCGVTIYQDSVPPGGGFFPMLYTSAWGDGSFTFIWSTGDTSSSIAISADGTYCVSVTDGTGCVSSECITITGGSQCDVQIIEGNASIFAITPPGSGFTYLWNTGETTSSIVPSGSGTYCVTVTLPGTTCEASICYFYQSPVQSFILQGFVYPMDSLQQPIFEGVAELYSIDNQSNTFSLFSTTPLVNNPNGFANHYDFGQVPAGTYIVKIMLDPASPYYEDYLPTYHYSELLWNEADLIPIPHSGWAYFSTILIEGGSPGGPGIIGGTITDGDGLVGHGNDEGENGANPMPNISVLLLDQQEQPLAHDLTDENGQFSFPDLAWGTYKVVVEIVGMPQAWYWVTIGPDQPSVTNVDFEVTPDGIVLGIGEAVKNSDFVVAPNPASSVVTLQVQSAAAFDAQLTLTSATGGILLSQQQSIARGNQRIELNINDLPSGVYFLNLVGGKEIVSKMVVKK